MISPQSSHCTELSYLFHVPIGFQELWSIATSRLESIMLLVVPQLYITPTPSQHSNIRAGDVQVLVLSMVQPTSSHLQRGHLNCYQLLLKIHCNPRHTVFMVCPLNDEYIHSKQEAVTKLCLFSLQIPNYRLINHIIGLSSLLIYFSVVHIVQVTLHN